MKNKRKLLVSILAGIMAVIMVLGLILSLIPTASAASSSEIKKQITQLKKEREELKKQMEEIKKQYEMNEDEIANIVSQKNIIDQEIFLMYQKIDNINNQIISNDISVDLMCDIHMPDDSRISWTPVDIYSGNFNGNGYEISGLKFVSDTDEN